MSGMIQFNKNLLRIHGALYPLSLLGVSITPVSRPLLTTIGFAPPLSYSNFGLDVLVIRAHVASAEGSSI